LPLYFCLISFRATCFVATRAPSRPMRWRGLSLIALARGFDQATDLALGPFFYLPFMHSEALIDQDRSVRLYEALCEAEQLRYATEHREVVQRFGRFPHRNRALGRDTTPAEQAFLEASGFDGSNEES
jgi:uncharacterized protein (DUF924 family)